MTKMSLRSDIEYFILRYKEQEGDYKGLKAIDIANMIIDNIDVRLERMICRNETNHWVYLRALDDIQKEFTQ